MSEVARKHRAAKQRRTARAQEATISTLRDQLGHAETRASFAEHKARTAVESAFRMLDGHKDQIQHAMRYMTRWMVEQYGPKLADAAQELIQARNRERLGGKPFEPDFSATLDDREVRILNIRGEIPAIRYNIQIGLW